VAKQKRIGLLPNALQESPRPEHIPAWEAMKPRRREYEANRMTTLAAMIDCVDQQVGRLVADLRFHNELDDTLFLFCRTMARVRMTASVRCST
jgi:arylsulfatase